MSAPATPCGSRTRPPSSQGQTAATPYHPAYLCAAFHCAQMQTERKWKRVPVVWAFPSQEGLPASCLVRWPPLLLGCFHSREVRFLVALSERLELPVWAPPLSQTRDWKHSLPPKSKSQPRTVSEDWGVRFCSHVSSTKSHSAHGLPPHTTFRQGKRGKKSQTRIFCPIFCCKTLKYLYLTWNAEQKKKTKQKPTKVLQGRWAQYSSKHSNSSTHTGASPKICPLSVTVPQTDLPFSSKHAGYLPAKHTGRDWNHGLIQKVANRIVHVAKSQAKMSSVNWLFCLTPY